MKVLTKQEEEAHYKAVIHGGLSGGLGGLGLGLGAAFLLHRRWPFFRHLTLPLKAFFVTSTGTFSAIITADQFSRRFEASQHADLRVFHDSRARARAEALAQMTAWERLKRKAEENRYPIVVASWALGMGVSLAAVGRNRYLSTAQKIVQARLYAQGLTLAVLVATAGFEVADAKRGGGRYETVLVVDPEDPEHRILVEKKVRQESYSGEDLWKDMVETEERRMKERKEAMDRAKAG